MTHKTQATAIPHKQLDLTIEVLAGQNLPLPPSEKKAASFRPYVKVEVHVEEPEELAASAAQASKAKAAESAAKKTDPDELPRSHKAKTKPSRGTSPEFGGEILAFRSVPGVIEELSFVRFTIWHDELGRDDFAGWASVRLDRLASGLRLVRLTDAAGQRCENPPAVLLVKVTKNVY